MAEETADSDEKFVPKNHQKTIVAVLGVALVLAGGIYAYQSGMLETDSTNNIDQPVQNETSEAAVNKSVGLTASQIEGDIVNVNITDIKAEPASPRIAPEDGIRFVNQAGVGVQFNFSRNIDSFKMEAGEEVIVDPKAIVYYEVTPQDEEVEFRDISARINVQG